MQTKKKLFINFARIPPQFSERSYFLYRFFHSFWGRINCLCGPWTIPLVDFFLLTLFIVLPLFFHRGFLFLLDWNFPLPDVPFPSDPTNNFFLFEVLYWFLNRFFPGDVLQKIHLSIAFFLAGFGMFRFLRILRPYRTTWGAYFGALLFLFNPFVYSRILVGQWIVVTAYALLPWFFVSFLLCMKQPTWRRSFVVALWWTMMVTTNLHIAILASIPVFFVFLFSLVSSGKQWTSVLKCGGLVALFFLFLNSYWIVPLLLGKSFLLNALQNVTLANTLLFSTRPDPEHGILWNTAALYGFWADDDQRYIVQKLIVPYWFYIFFPILFLVFWGSIRSFFRKFSAHDDVMRWIFIMSPRAFFLALVCTGIFSFFFSVGASSQSLRPLMIWLYDTLFLFRGFRESHKAVALLVFVYAIFGSIGVDDIIFYIRSWLKKLQLWTVRFRFRSAQAISVWLSFVSKSVHVIFLIIPLLYSPGLLWGFQGQLQPRQYPESWFAADRFLQNDQDDFRALFFPWHQYMSFSFAQHIMATPAEKFFHKSVIAGDNIEFGPLYTQSTRRESRLVEQEILAKKSTLKTMGSTLLSLNVKYVILVEEVDFSEYQFLEQQEDLQLVFQDERIKIFRNLQWTKAYFQGQK